MMLLQGRANCAQQREHVGSIGSALLLRNARSRLLATNARNRSCLSAVASSATDAPLRVCIVGAGAAGLTTALRLLQLQDPPRPTATSSHKPRPKRPIEVTILADAFEGDTTSAGAAGLWGPYKLSDTPEHLVNAWGGQTYDHLMQLAHSPDAAAAGISLCSAHSFYPEPLPELPSWHTLTHNFQLLDPRMLKVMSRHSRQDPWIHTQAAGGSTTPSPNSSVDGSSHSTSSSSHQPSAFSLGRVDISAEAAAAAAASLPHHFHYGWGYHFQSVVCEGTRYLPWLRGQVEARGGRLVRRRLESLEEVVRQGPGRGGGAEGAGTAGVYGSSGGSGAPYDVVVNCAGLRSKELLGDEEVYPIRGQIMRVRAPWVTQAYFWGDFYIIPNPASGTVVLGGTGQVGNPSREVCPEDAARIWYGCTRLLPSLRDAQVVSHWVGLRPGRSRVRLELDAHGLAVGQGVQERAQTQEQGPAGGAPGSSSTSDGGGPHVVPLVHNYGHGGAGLTLAWGCAGDVVSLLVNAGVVV